MGEENLFGFISMSMEEKEGEEEEEQENMLDDAPDDALDGYYEADDENPDACDEGLESPREHGEKRQQGLQDYARLMLQATMRRQGEKP